MLFAARRLIRALGAYMNESLKQFREWCLRAFAFLSQYGFTEVESDKEQFNPYCVSFSNGEIQLVVKGEGYGSIASISYVNRDGVEVPSQFLEPNWGPQSLFRKKKKKKGPSLTQEQQVFNAADRIKERDGDILQGGYARLDEVGVRWKNIKERLFGGRA
jgi:hypothetical protein